MRYGVLHSSVLDLSSYEPCFEPFKDEVSVCSTLQVDNPNDITFALLWFPDDDFFIRFPNVTVVASIASGVDSILACPSLHPGVKVCRNRDPEQASIMSTFALWHVINHQRNFPLYRDNQKQKKWQRLPMIAPSEINVGVLGLGFLGERIANDLSYLGFNVSGWRKSHQNVPNEKISVFSGSDQLGHFLSQTEILICILPLTSETQGILNQSLFSQLKPNAYLVHLARGEHLVEKDLLDALDNGQLSGASIDVFEQEPLPKTSALWEHDKLIITPHDASDVRPNVAVSNLLEELRRHLQGMPLKNEILTSTGY
jgi:glyoxylate/hydroxypyruvate reductase A